METLVRTQHETSNLFLYESLVGRPAVSARADRKLSRDSPSREKPRKDDSEIVLPSYSMAFSVGRGCRSRGRL